MSTHVRLGLRSGLFSSGFPTNILYAFLFSPITATCPTHLILLNLSISNILLNTLFSNTLSLCSSLNSRDQVSHPYRTTGKIIVLHILNLFLYSRQEEKMSLVEW
ncbi:hypothetical protein B7P43_G08216 [Cryptotermes secundus]|uniref:Uncharacterized protein n=1 Tax=Cryptotermes secundus TaxID=105785 RepID=A0A2J7PSF5_9NEOP|nr:hypothetical protein B7P43_G08216 [Cryptotermes secundus]